MTANALPTVQTFLTVLWSRPLEWGLLADALVTTLRGLVLCTERPIVAVLEASFG